MKPSVILLLALSGLLCTYAPGEDTIRLLATPALGTFARDLVNPLHDDLGIAVKLLPEAGNTQVIAALGAGECDAALITRPIKVEERAAYPEHRLTEITLGTHAVALAVSRLVWENGLRALKRDQVMQIYESKFRNWKDLGGEDRPLQFFEPAHGRGPWEIFATWLYGDTLKAPGVPWQTVNEGADTQSALQFSSGGMSVSALRWIDRVDEFPLAIIGDDGKPIEPSNANIAAGTYPLVRPVILAFADEPVTKKKKMVEYLLGEKGQGIVAARDFVPQPTLKAP